MSWVYAQSFFVNVPVSKIWLRFVLKTYDLILIGTGSGMELVDVMIRNNHELKVAVRDKDAPGGICLIRGCIPSKLLIYTANIIRAVQNSSKFGIQPEIKRINFEAVMQRMR